LHDQQLGCLGRVTAVLVEAKRSERGAADRHAKRSLRVGCGDKLARPRAVGAYNLMHRFWGPLAMSALAVFGLIGLGFVIGALAWAFHIALDRAFGYGLRTPGGFQRP
jgi:hypothetical protein